MMSVHSSGQITTNKRYFDANSDNEEHYSNEDSFARDFELLYDLVPSPPGMSHPAYRHGKSMTQAERSPRPELEIVCWGACCNRLTVR